MRVYGKASIGAGTSIGADSAIGKGARIGAGVRIGARVTVDAGAIVLDQSVVLPGTRVRSLHRPIWDLGEAGAPGFFDLKQIRAFLDRDDA